MRVAAPAILIAIGLIGLIVAGVVQGGIPELQVAQLLAADTAPRGTIKVHGVLSEIHSGERPLHFEVADKADPSRVIVVKCDRSRPDTFQKTYDIAVQGTWDAKEGVFVANQIFTKCPSKYEAEDRLKAGTVDGPIEPTETSAAPSTAAPVAAPSDGVE